MLTQREFLERIEAFLSATKMKPSVFGVGAVKDPNFVFDLRKGRVPNLAVVERVLKFMDSAAVPQESDGHQPTTGEAA